MSYFSKWIDRKIKKIGLTGCVMYIVKKYVKMTPSKKDDKFLRDVDAMFSKFEGVK